MHYNYYRVFEIYLIKQRWDKDVEISYTRCIHGVTATNTIMVFRKSRKNTFF